MCLTHLLYLSASCTSQNCVGLLLLCIVAHVYRSWMEMQLAVCRVSLFVLLDMTLLAFMIFRCLCSLWVHPLAGTSDDHGRMYVLSVCAALVGCLTAWLHWTGPFSDTRQPSCKIWSIEGLPCRSLSVLPGIMEIPMFVASFMCRQNFKQM
jgi:hypothetical protein